MEPHNGLHPNELHFFRLALQLESLLAIILVGLSSGILLEHGDSWNLFCGPFSLIRTVIPWLPTLLHNRDLLLGEKKVIVGGHRLDVRFPRSIPALLAETNTITLDIRDRIRSN